MMFIVCWHECQQDPWPWLEDPSPTPAERSTTGSGKKARTHLLHLPHILHHWLHLHAQHKHCYYVIKTITHRQGPSSWKHHIMRANALKWNKGNLWDIRGALSSEPIIILDIKQICDISWSTVVSCLLPTQFSWFIFCYGENKMKTDWTKTIINNYYLEQLLITLEQQHKTVYLQQENSTDGGFFW